MDLRQMAMRIAAAKTIPEYVAAGNEVQAIADDYAQMAEQFKTIYDDVNSRIQKHIQKMAGLKQSTSEHGLKVSFDELLRGIHHSRFSPDSLASDQKKLQALASSLKKTLR